MNTGKVHLSQVYIDRLRALHDDKVSINDAKIKHLGHIDIDDHGFIHFPDFTFTAKSNHPSGMVIGARAIGENFRRYLNEIPTYINPNSALATCWAGPLPAKMGFAPEDAPVHLRDTIKKYRILQPGCGAMNHLCPDMNMGRAAKKDQALQGLQSARRHHSV